MNCIVTEPQLEEITLVNKAIRQTNYWGFIDTPDGKMFLAGNDDGIVIRLYNGYLYEPVSLALWRERAAGAAIALDVGAHTGIYSLAALKAGARRVISIEPYFLNLARLMLNLRANGYTVSDCVNAAASDQHDAIGHIYTLVKNKAYCSTGSTLFSRVDAAPSPVRLIRLDHLIHSDKYGDVAVIKLDVENSLRIVLRGSQALLAVARPDLIFECFESGITEMLQPMGYQFWLIDEVHGLTPVAAVEPQIMGKCSRNYLASMRHVDDRWLA